MALKSYHFLILMIFYYLFRFVLVSSEPGVLEQNIKVARESLNLVTDQVSEVSSRNIYILWICFYVDVDPESGLIPKHLGSGFRFRIQMRTQTKNKFLKIPFFSFP